MTIYDIAKEAGVAASTVSRVINDKPGIKAETREKIQKLLKKHNYTPNEVARGLVMQSSKIIGILMGDIRVAHHTDSAYMMEQELTKSGYCCITMSTGTDTEKQVEYLRMLEQRRVDGVILLGSMYESPQMEQGIKRYLGNIPVILANGSLDLPNVYGIVVNEYDGVKDCVRLLWNKGRRNMAYIIDVPTPSNLNKQYGFSDQMKEYEKEGGTQTIYHCKNTGWQDGYDVTKAILLKAPKTDGFIYATDVLAAGGLRAFYDLKIAVPEAVSVIGVDNTVYSEITRPRITALDNNMKELSVVSSKILLDVLNKKTRHHKRTLKTTIIKRETT